MFKKASALFTALVLLLCLCGCSKTDGNNSSQEVEVIYEYDTEYEEVENENTKNLTDDSPVTQSSVDNSSSEDDNMQQNNTSTQSSNTVDTQSTATEDNGFSLSDASVLSKIKLNGRTLLTSDGVALEYSASSIEFKANCSGTVYLQYTKSGSDNRYFSVYVDGTITQNRTVLDEEGYMFLARNLSKGEHTFKVITDTEVSGGPLVTFKKISVNGELISVNSSAPVIEFLGDSLTSGRGALCKDGTANYHYTQYESSTAAYPYLIAQSLGYDYRIVSKAGIGLKAYGSTMPDFLDFYKAENYLRGNKTAFTSQKVSDVDVVVVNLGTNDEGTAKVYDSSNASIVAQYSQYYADLITGIGYDKDTKILFVAGVGGCTGYYNSFEGAKQILNSAGYSNVYYYKANRYMSGGGKHPTADEHKTVANEILNILKKNGMV